MADARLYLDAMMRQPAQTAKQTTCPAPNSEAHVGSKWLCSSGALHAVRCVFDSGRDVALTEFASAASANQWAPTWGGVGPHRRPCTYPSTIMENFVNMGRQFLKNQQENGNANNSGGFDIQNIVSNAMGHNEQQDQNDQSQLFSQVTSFLQQKQNQGQINDQVNEGDLMSSFKKVMQGGGGGSSQEVGQAAAVGAFQQIFGQGGQQANGGTDVLISKAITLVQKHGGDSEAMNHASETVMKLIMKHKLQSMLGGGGGGGNLSGLMSLLS